MIIQQSPELVWEVEHLDEPLQFVDTVCEVANGVYQRGWAYRDLDCEAFFRVAAAQYYTYACWLMDECSRLWPLMCPWFQ